MHCLACAAALAAASASASQSEARIAVPDIRPLLVAAIDAPDGKAQGVLTGALANALTDRFKGTSAIHIDIATQRRYAQEGCRRLKVSFSQDGVQLPSSGVPSRRTVDFTFDYCRDGRPPRSLS